MGAAPVRRSLALALAAVLLAGCSGISNPFRGSSSKLEPPAALVEFEASARIVTAWSRNVGASAGKRFLRLRPAVADGRVYAAGRGGDVSAFDVRTGEQLWRTDTDTPISGGPGIGEGLVLVGTSDGETLALAADTGELAWRQRVSSEVLAAPLAASGVVVVRTQDGKLAGLSARDGSRLWVYERAVPALSLRGTSSPVVAENLVVAGFDNGLLVALSLVDGQLLWESRIATARGRSELERLVDIDADPVVQDGLVYVATYQGRVAAVDQFSGRIIWRRDMSSHAGLGASARNVFVTDDQSFVWALDRESSASVWRQDGLARRNLTAPAPFRGYVAVGDYEGYVHLLEEDDGRFAARLKVDGDGLASAPVPEDDLLLIYGRSGTLTALTLE